MIPNPVDPGQFYQPGRTALLSQGDIFRNVPFVDLVLSDPHDLGSRRIDLEPAWAMLITPTEIMRALGATKTYSDELRRTVVPILGLDQMPGLGDGRALREQDGLAQYMYLPEDPISGMLEGAAYFPHAVTVSHALLVPSADEPISRPPVSRATQLTIDGTRQLQRKLLMYFTALRTELAREVFSPPEG